MKANFKTSIAIPILFLLLTIDSLFSQNIKLLKHDNFYADCENRYVVLPNNSDPNKFFVGFVYLDQVAGYTFNAEMNISTDEKGEIKTFEKANPMAILKLRLGRNTTPLALFPNELLGKMNLKEEPEWLAIYKTPDPVKHDIIAATHLNGQGYYERAVLLLEKQKVANPHAQNLEFELGYSYNSIDQYDKSIDLLENAIKISNKNPLLYKELGFAFQKKGEYKEAISILKKGISVAEENHKSTKAEMAYNIAVAYKNNLNNEKEFQYWGAKSYKWISETSELAKSLRKYGLKIEVKADTARLDGENNIVFNDKVLEDLVRKKLSINRDKQINITDVLKVSVLDVSGDIKDENFPKIKDIDALKYFQNLHKLTARSHSIKDLNPIRNLKEMKVLELSNNQISSLEPLSKLVNLEVLDLRFNKISDLIPLKNLTKLKDIDMFNNDIYSLDGIENLVELKSVSFGSNHISDVKLLSSLPKLQTLWMFNNPVRNFKVISGLGKTLKTLSIAQCELSDISFLKNFMELETLIIFDNLIDDLSPIVQMTKLQNLLANNCRIKDLSVVVTLVKNNAFQTQRQKYKYQLDVSGNMVDYNDIQTTQDRIFLLQRIPKSNF
ncbi:MAG: leucine-rich repeat domain-containing protein [Bacteroidales bacterium]